MDLSIVIPLYNEDESIDELHSKIVSSLSNLSLNYEIIFIDDGSTDNSWNIIKDVTKKVHNTRAIRFLTNYGKSMALSAGFKSTRGEVVVTMDADLQDDPNEILQLYNVLINEDYHIVSGWKKKRYDSVIFKNLPSKLFNWAARLSSGIKLNDFNCGIKAYKSDVIKEIKLTSGMHRYIPVLAKNSGFNKIGEKIVLHHPRKHGKTKYGADRFIKGFLDLITLSFIERFGKRPMHFFGLFGTFILITGLIFSIYLGVDKLFINTTSRLITERPEFYIALASMIIGSQFFLAGFLGEIILRNKKLNNYKIKEKINLDE
ncbi:MAG: glycosyltransferase family 2 protein [Flavobacteriaceae bacterium]|nr:glycosyltransferase family 2 protein [Flavobacteriaceae bacterium]MBL6684023.1 glycosyltransferase family 2 protein [Flavobacteriaceae bacterium]